jgi:hypothetical protein
MKLLKFTYWVSTGLVTLGMLFSVYNYFYNPALKVAYTHIGFPDWFRVELGIAKLLGALALIIPQVPVHIKEWAYFGFFVNFLSAFFAHYMVNDPVSGLVAPISLLLLVITSYITFHQLILKTKQK